MSEDLKKLYDGVSTQLDIGDYNTFVQKMQTPADRKKFYDVVSQNGLDLGDYNAYEQRLSSVKKKGNTTPVQKSGLQNGSVSASTSPLRSNTVPDFTNLNIAGVKGSELAQRIQQQKEASKNIGLKPVSQEQKFISAKQTTTPQVLDDYRTIIQKGIQGQIKMDATFQPLSKPIVEAQTKKEVQQLKEQQQATKIAKKETHQNIYAVIPELAQAKNTDEAISTILKSDMKDNIDMWQQLDDNTLINADETTINDFLVNSGLKSADRELYLKGQAQSNPKYLYDYEQNKIGSLYKAVEQRAKDYEAVLKQQYGDNFFERAKTGDDEILSNPDFNNYIALKEKQQSLSSKANTLINDSRFKEVKEEKEQKEIDQLISDEIAKADKWYNPKDELRYVKSKLAYAAGKAVKMFAELPALATSVDKGYDWTDKVADWGDRFAEGLVDAVPVSSDMKAGFMNTVAKVDGYKVIVDAEGNPVDVRDANNFKVPVSQSNQVIDKYNAGRDKYKTYNEKSWGSLADNGLNTVIDMGEMIIGTKGVGMLGAGQKLQKLTSMGIAYQQTKRDVYNEAIKKGLDPRNADVLSNIVGIAAGTSSALNPMEYNIASGKGLLSFLKSDGLNASKLALIKEGKLSVKEYTKEFVKKGIKNTIGENIEELGIENTTQALANNYFNGKISATDMQDGGLDENLHIFDKHGLETLLITAGSAFLMTPLEIKSQTQLNQQEALKMAIENPEDFVKIREMQVKKGVMTQEQVDAEKVIYDGVSKTYNAIKDDIKPELQPQLLALLTKKYNLSNRISAIKDEVLSAPYTQQLEEINKGIQDIANGKNPSDALSANVQKSEVIEKAEKPTDTEQATAVNIRTEEFDDKPVIEKIEEVNVPQETVITETVDESTAVPASEMDEQQLNQIFEEKIANPQIDEIDNILEKIKKKTVNETEITPNELIEQGREQDVSQGLQGEYQNNQGVQQSSGIGQVSQQEDVAEKVEEKVDEILSTKKAEITPQKTIEIDRNVDSEDKAIKDNRGKKPNGYYIDVVNLQEDGTADRVWEKAENAMPVKEYPTLDIFSHKKNGKVIISENNTGKKLVEADTIKEAKEKLKELINKNGGEQSFKDKINQSIQQATPTAKEQGVAEAVQQGTDAKRKEVAKLQDELDNINQIELELKGKELVGDALDRIANKIGGKKNLTEQEKTTLIKDVSDLAKGLIQMGKATLDNVLEKVIEEIKKRLPDLDNTTVNELAENIEQKVLLSAVVDKFKEKGYSYEQAKEKLDKANADYNEKELKDAWNGSDSSGNTKHTQQEDGVKKRVVTERAYEGTVRDEVKSELEKLGLYRDKVSQEERAKQADSIIDKIGEEMALEAVKNFDIRGAVATSVLARLIKRIDDKMINLSATDVDELSALAKEQAELIELMGKEAYFGGEYNAQLGYEYLNSDIGYNVEKKIQEFKDQNNGVIPEDVERKFRELDAQYQQLKKDYAEAEKRAIEAEQKQAVENIKESIKREKKIRTYAKRGDDLIAEGLDELASYLGTKLMVEGTNRPQLTKALSKIGKGLIDKGIATIDNVFDKVKEYVASKFGDKVQIDDLKDDIVKGVVDKMPKATIRDGKISVPHQLIRELVESGIEDINDLAKEIQNRLKGQYPDVEIREIRDAITGYGKTVNPNREEIEKQIRKMKRIGKIESALEDVRNKKRPLRSGVQRDKLETEERARLKELREAMKDLPMDEQTLERELKTQLDAEKTRVQNRIDDLQREIDKNELTPRNARTLKEDAELKALKEKLEAVKKEHDEKFKNDDYKEKKRLELSKKLTQNRINELQRRLRENDFSKTVRKPLIADTELIRLKAEKLRIQEEFDKEFYKNKLKNRTKAEKLKDVLFEIWGLTRALRATGEASFVGIQGLVNTISHPTHAKEAFKTAFKTMRSEKYTEDFLRGIKSQEWYPALKGSKLSLTEPHAELSAREELFVSDWFTYLWNALGTPLKANEKAFETWKSANPLKAVERAAVGYLDTLRVMRFLDGMEMLKMKGQTFENNPQAYKDMADVINTLTGRASLGRLEQNADMLSKVFFSPRNWASMLKQTVLLPRQLYKWRDKTPDAKLTEISVANKMALSDLSKFVGLTTAMVAMFAAGLNNDDDDETGVELDPRSSDFAKIKIGKKRIDPWGGRIQQVVLLSKLIMDSVKNSKGEIVPLGVPYKSPTKADLLLRMATNKLSPSMALVNEYLLSTVKFDKQTGEKIRMSPYEYGGGEYDFTDKLLGSTYPIYWSTVYDLIKDDANALNGILAFYAFFGGGVNVYDDKKKDKNNTKTNPTEKDIPFIKK